MTRLFGIRVLIVVTVALGIDYVVWRWLFSVNWSAWWIAVPLVVVETYSLIDCMLFGLTMWKFKERPEPGPPLPDVTVDVFITTYNEPIDLVMGTALAAKAIHYPHRTWVLDDGARPEMRTAAEADGIGYITRSDEWVGHSRHAKAGNLNNALGATDGEFILILDADQVPKPTILDRTLAYFADPTVALVQTQQFFINVPEQDPLGSQAPLFYGPIQQGKDGWNAAFFCGSNAVLRREAMMQMGVRGYVKEVEGSIRKALRAADQVLTKARKRRGLTPGEATAIDRVSYAVVFANGQLSRGELLAEITFDFQVAVDDATREVVSADLAELEADLAEIDRLSGSSGRHRALLVDDAEVEALARRDWSPLGALESVRALVKTIDVDRFDEAQPVMPMATISVTEDMATAMRLHSHGWKTVYHHESLADGLAPEDLSTMLTQRLRWAQGTMQVMMRENPLVQKGLSIPQKLMYFATMWSYLSGFAALVYIAAPILYLCFGVLPVHAFSIDFFIRLIPFLVCNQLLFVVIARGIRTWRGMQYSLALFPVWIKAFTTAFGNVFFGKSLGFAVTPKTKQEWSPQWALIRPQLIAMVLLFISCIVGAVRMFTGHAAVSSTLINIAWVGFDLLLLGAVITAARYRGFVAHEPSEKGVSV
ncbi:cellulose synthase (UDP-forming) [Nakamurella sp. UYEF19]|uniref:glycosyltransferase family 2 protein n=1 Tax=Nakamurella sp. UYEF19 TaxID=1756392 RepID=UPI00339AE4D3